MSSILKVDTIQDQDGNNIINESGNVITIGASGDTITVPAGATLSGDLNADNLTSGTVPDARITGAYTGITGLTITSSAPKLIIQDSGTHGTNSAPRLEFKDSSSIQGFVDFADDGTMRIDQLKANPLTFLTNNVERMRITSAGIVQINGTTGTRELNVSGDNTRIGIYSTNNSTGAGQVQFGDVDNEQIGRIMYEHNTNAMTLHTNNAERMRIDSSGNVGIGGTPSSTQRLIVNGDGSSIIGGIEFRNASGGGSTASIGMASGTSNALLIAVNAAANMVFKNTGGTERMRINSSGNLLVGNTDNATSANLDVRNSIGIQDTRFFTIELGGGHSGSISTITLTYQAYYDGCETIIEAQMFGYSGKYLDHLMGSYSNGGATVMRNNASGATVAFSTSATGTAYLSNFTHIITVSATHPIVKYKISRGGGNGNGFTTKPTITFA